MSIPALVSLCTYEEAAQIRYSVQESVERLVRYAWIEKRASDMGLYWLNSTPEWEVKEALSLHLYLDTEHVALIRKRVSEMRNPAPRMDVSPDKSLNNFLEEILQATSTLERVVGLYAVLKPALLAAYRKHYEHINPLVAYPTRRILRMMIMEEEDAVAWGELAVAALREDAEDRKKADIWIAHLEAYLQAAGGIMGDQIVPDILLPEPYAQGEYQADFFPRRDTRFIKQDNFLFPPHEVARQEGVPVDEKTLALMCKRTLEMDVPEMMAPIIIKTQNQPWEYYVGMCRQLWDEARHAMMGSVYFEHNGIDWKGQIPLHVGFSLHMNMHTSPLEAHAVLYTIEQSLMPAKTGKRYEWVTADRAEDDLAKLFQDYDWADEVLHAQIGRQWLIPLLDVSRDEVIEIGQKRAMAINDILAQYADPQKQVNWWPDFVQLVLGKQSQMNLDNIRIGDPVYRKSEAD